MPDEKVEPTPAQEPPPPPVEALVVTPPSQALESVRETAANAVAARSRATIEARSVMAIKRPRDLDSVRISVLKECRRPTFARVARYSKPVSGEKRVQGPSIRFAELAVRLMGNILQDTITTFDDPDRRIVHVSFTDLETNASYERDITISKTVERKTLRKGQTPIAQRRNSKDEVVYIVEATEDDLVTKEAAAISKAIRTLGLRLVPGDLVDEAMKLVSETIRDEAAKDPDAERKKVCDAFSEMGVVPAELAKYLGHPLEQSTPSEIEELRGIWTALKEGDVTWVEVLRFRGSEPEGTPKGGAIDRIRAAAGAKTGKAPETREPGAEG